MNDPQDFLQVMRAPAPERYTMPKMEQHAGSEALKTWQDAITGRAPEQGLADTRKAATSWFEQFDLAKPATTVL